MDPAVIKCTPPGCQQLRGTQTSASNRKPCPNTEQSSPREGSNASPKAALNIIGASTFPPSGRSSQHSELAFVLILDSINIGISSGLNGDYFRTGYV
jgi:hypothetical protein